MSDSPEQDWFREARPAGAGWNVAKTAVQTAVFWVVFLLVLPTGIVRIEDTIGVPGFTTPWSNGVGVALFLTASLLGLSSGYTMATAGRGTPLPTDSPRQLVTSGPYAFVRNPMAIAGLAQGAAVGLMLGSWGVLLYVLAGALIWNTWVRPAEEAYLAIRFGRRFQAYCRRVTCWLPRF